MPGPKPVRAAPATLRRALGACALAAAVNACAGGGPNDAGGGTDVVSAADGGAVALGAMLVQRHSCATCHTSPNPSDGILSGQTTAQPGTRAYPPNLTPDPTTGLGGWTDDAIVRAIREGINNQGAMLCVMPVFSQLSESDARAIVAFLRSIPAVVRTIPATECALDAGRTDARVPTDVPTDTARADTGGPDTSPAMDAAMDVAMDTARPDVVTAMDASDVVSAMDVMDATTGTDAARADASDVTTPPADTGGCTPVLTVNEIQVAGAAGAGDEFVEIYNAGSCTASLTGYTLKYEAAASTTETTRWTGTATDTIAPGGYFVVAGVPFTGTAQGRFAGASGVLAATGGAVGVYSPAGTRLDSVGYGTGTMNTLTEGTAAAAPPSAQSIARQPDGADTNNNSTDLHPLATPTPGAANR